MASDSKVVSIDRSSGSAVSVSENSKKIHKVNNKIIGFAGVFNHSFKDLFLKSIKECTSKNTGLESFTEIAIDLVNQYLALDEHDLVNICVRIGEVRGSIPAVSGFNANKSMAEIVPHYNYARTPGFQLIFAGESPQKDIKNKYVTEIRNSNFTPIAVGNYAVEYLKEMARLYPETCNQSIVKEVLI